MLFRSETLVYGASQFWPIAIIRRGRVIDCAVSASGRSKILACATPRRRGSRHDGLSGNRRNLCEGAWNGLTQAAIAHYLQHGRYEYHLKNMRIALHTQCLRYMKAIIEYFPQDSKVSRPHGGFVLWVQLNKKVNAFKLRSEAMKHHISIVPGKIFSASCNYDSCIRISFSKPWDEDVDYGLLMLGKLIKKML